MKIRLAIILTLLVIGVTVSMGYILIDNNLANIGGAVQSPGIIYDTVTFDLGALDSLTAFSTPSQCACVSIDGLDVEYVLIEAVNLSVDEFAAFRTLNMGLITVSNELGYVYFHWLNLKNGDKIAVLGNDYSFYMDLYGDTAIVSLDTEVAFSVTFNPAVVTNGQLEQHFRVRDNVTYAPLEGAVINFGGHTYTTDEYGFCLVLSNHEQSYNCSVSLISYRTQEFSIVIGINPIYTIWLDKAP